jgi:chemotaxis signal transduction protein
VELDGQSVPIIDANVWLRARPPLLDASTCIVIAERRRQAERYCGGVLVPDIDEVMRLAAGDFDSIGRADAGVNMRLVLTMDEDEAATTEPGDGPGEPDAVGDGWTWRLGRIFCREIRV